MSHTPKRRILSCGVGLKVCLKVRYQRQSPLESLGDRLLFLLDVRLFPNACPWPPVSARMFASWLWTSQPPPPCLAVTPRRTLKAGQLFFPMGAADVFCLGPTCLHPLFGGFSFLFRSGQWGIELAVCC